MTMLVARDNLETCNENLIQFQIICFVLILACLLKIQGLGIDLNYPQEKMVLKCHEWSVTLKRHFIAAILIFPFVSNCKEGSHVNMMCDAEETHLN